MSKVGIAKYLISTIGLFLFFLLNYFHLNIEAYLPFLPKYSILTATIIITIFLGHLLLKREKEIENIQYQFLTIITHKFRTPLTAIKWLTENLMKEVSREEKLNIANQMKSSVSRLSEAVDTLSGLAKFNSKMDYAFELAWLREMIDVSLLRYQHQFKEKNITFSIITDHEIPLVIIDKRKIQFVLDTLIENAVLYSTVDGRIDISLKKQGGFVILSVKDNGIGIEKENLKKIFGQFFRTDSAKTIDTEGMGLSLFMISEIVKKHGGKIWVESDGKNKGSTFFVKLKISRKKK